MRLTNDVSIMEDLTPREYDEPGYDSESALFLGLLIHKYLEKHSFGNSLDEDLLHNIWEMLSDSEGSRYGLDENTLLELRERSLRQLRNTVCDKRLIKVLGGRKCYAEVPFLFSAYRGIEFRGVIDRLSRDMDKEHWEIIDWKSNDLEGKDPEDVAEENDYHLQLACYKWAVERILNEKVGGLYIYFTDKGYLLESLRQVDPEQMVNEMLEKIWEYEGNRDHLTRDLEEMRKGMKECRFCEYKESFCRG